MGQYIYNYHKKMLDELKYPSYFYVRRYSKCLRKDEEQHKEDSTVDLVKMLEKLLINLENEDAIRREEVEVVNKSEIAYWFNLEERDEVCNAVVFDVVEGISNVHADENQTVKIYAKSKKNLMLRLRLNCIRFKLYMKHFALFNTLRFCVIYFMLATISSAPWMRLG